MKNEKNKRNSVPTNFDKCTNDELSNFFCFAETVVLLQNDGIITFTENYDRDVELAELFRESYREWPYEEMEYCDFIEDFLIFKQTEIDANAKGENNNE